MNPRFAWIEGYKLRKVQFKLLVSVIFLAAALYFYSAFLGFVEARGGFSFNDPVLNIFNPVDLTWLIFSAIYLSLFTGIIILVRNPVRLTLAIQTYTVLI